jgi:glycosyltransferase involved in cell wall biosynthesis
VVTPLPPQASGVADYSYRLLEHLARHRPIDVFVEDEALPVEAPDGVRVMALSDIHVADRAAGGYRDVLYCLGNSAFHAAMLPVLDALPGPVLAHDVRFTGLYGWIQEHRPEYGLATLPALIEQQYGARVPEGLGAGGFVHPVEADRYGVLLARDLIARSTAFLVHSRYAAELALLDADPVDRHKVAHVPYGAPEAAGFLPRDPQPGLIATFGHVSEMKQLSKLVEAFAVLAADQPDLRLAIVGPATEHERERLFGQLSKLGLPARVNVTGQVPRAEYLRWLARATVAVQLRAAPNGETSGAVADCLTAGVPTIVTGVGAARELPRGSVVPVERDVSAHGLADRIAGLLESVERRLALSAAGRAWAAEASIERAAAAIATTLASQRP